MFLFCFRHCPEKCRLISSTLFESFSFNFNNLYSFTIINISLYCIYALTYHLIKLSIDNIESNLITINLIDVKFNLNARLFVGDFPYFCLWKKYPYNNLTRQGQMRHVGPKWNVWLNMSCGGDDFHHMTVTPNTFTTENVSYRNFQNQLQSVKIG